MGQKRAHGDVYILFEKALNLREYYLPDICFSSLSCVSFIRKSMAQLCLCPWDETQKRKINCYVPGPGEQLSEAATTPTARKRWGSVVIQMPAQPTVASTC